MKRILQTINDLTGLNIGSGAEPAPAARIVNPEADIRQQIILKDLMTQLNDKQLENFGKLKPETVEKLNETQLDADFVAKFKGVLDAGVKVDTWVEENLRDQKDVQRRYAEIQNGEDDLGDDMIDSDDNLKLPGEDEPRNTGSW